MDKSNWIASLTSVSGCFNGSFGPHASCIDENFLLKSDPKKYVETLAADVTCKAFKVFATAQNVIEPAGTQDVEPENVVKVFK